MPPPVKAEIASQAAIPAPRGPGGRRAPSARIAPTISPPKAMFERPAAPSSPVVNIPATILAPPTASQTPGWRSQRRHKNRRPRDDKHPAHSGGDTFPNTSRSTQAGSSASHARNPSIFADIFNDRYRLIADQQAVTYQTRLDFVLILTEELPSGTESPLPTIDATRKNPQPSIEELL